MPTEVTDIDTLQRYIRGVLSRAEHHASNVNQVLLALAGAIVWKKDREPIKVMEQDGDMKNVLWVRIGGNPYAFSYNHELRSVEMRKSSVRGTTLRAFTNATTLADLTSFFEVI